MGALLLCSLGLLAFVFSNSFLAVEADTCAREWLQYQGNCYGYFDRKMSWDEAEIECQTYHRGAHLASVLTWAERLVVAEHITTYKYQKGDVWIGLHDKLQKGRWRWADESAYNFQSWEKGEPNNLGDVEYCVELTAASKYKDWNDLPCSAKNTFICKHEL